MGLQLIFVIETNKETKSDWIYIKDTIEHFYTYERTQVKMSPVYMDGKGKYRYREKQVRRLISQYHDMAVNNRSKVLYCFDCDDYDSDPNDLKFLTDARKYCDNNGFEFVWFCKDIERVYIGKKVEDSRKKIEANTFRAKKLINNVDAKMLAVTAYRNNTSNIMNVLDQNQELERKK